MWLIPTIYLDVEHHAVELPPCEAVIDPRVLSQLLSTVPGSTGPLGLGMIPGGCVPSLSMAASWCFLLVPTAHIALCGQVRVTVPVVSVEGGGQHGGMA